MNILVIGNGFDLAHELPTKYTDFLEFCKLISKIYTSETLTLHVYKVICQDSKLNDELKNQLLNIFGSRKTHTYINNDDEMIDVFITDYPKSDELFMLINDNFWIEYFLQYNMHGKENWIDFESEISAVIQSLDNDMYGLSKIYNIEDMVYDLSNDFLKKMYSDYIDAVHPINPVDNVCSEGISFKKIKDKLLNDLNQLIRAFEIYLTEYVEKINVKVISPDIKEVAAMSYDDQGQKGILFSKIISFNYTNIYEQVYLSKHNIDCNDYIDYIHGKADINNTIDTSNMVLGIDEYLGKKKRNKQVDFIAFKKFFQRIHKGTGCKYKEWIDIIKGEFADYQTELEKSKAEKNMILLKAEINKLKKQYLNKHHVYIFGHSLDITDKDILRDLILNDNVYTTIFYRNQEQKGQQIANLVKIIGQDELIRRTGGSTRTIEFVLQQDMVPIES